MLAASGGECVTVRTSMFRFISVSDFVPKVAPPQTPESERAEDGDRGATGGVA